MNNVLSKRDRDALGAEYRGYARRNPLPGEAPPRTIAHQPWQSTPDTQWQPLRQGADAAMSVPRRGAQT